MKADNDIKADVMAELVWDPSVDNANVGVAVRNGVVTLSGQVDTFAQKHAAERAAMRVAGVRGVALDLDVRLAPHGRRSDTEIAQAALHALRWHSLVPDDAVKVEVEDGRVTLSGEVEGGHQRESALQCIRPLVGVVAIDNRITVKPRAAADDIATQITSALARHARREAGRIAVEVDGSVVTVTGRVDSLPEHDAAIGTAFATRGVSRVIDKLEVAA